MDCSRLMLDLLLLLLFRNPGRNAVQQMMVRFRKRDLPSVLCSLISVQAGIRSQCQLRVSIWDSPYRGSFGEQCLQALNLLRSAS